MRSKSCTVRLTGVVIYRDFLYLFFLFGCLSEFARVTVTGIYSSENYKLEASGPYFGTWLSMALSRSPSPLDPCGFAGLSPSCALTLCVANDAEWAVATASSLWSMEIGAELFHWIFETLFPLFERLSNVLQNHQRQ
jgi:hypothetical protein